MDIAIVGATGNVGRKKLEVHEKKDLSIDKSIHLSELTLPEGVEITLLQHGAEDSDMAVVVIHKARAEEVEEDLTAAPEASEVASDQKNDESNEKDKESEE